MKVMRAIFMVFGAFFIFILFLGAIGTMVSGPDPVQGKPPAIAQAAITPPSSAPTPDARSPAVSDTAEQHTSNLKAGDTASYLVLKPGALVIVWNNEDDMARGLKIAFAGTQNESLDLLKPLIRCTVKSGTKIVVVEAGELSSSVLVLSGRAHGCEGQVPNQYVKDTPR